MGAAVAHPIAVGLGAQGVDDIVLNAFAALGKMDDVLPLCCEKLLFFWILFSSSFVDQGRLCDGAFLPVSIGQMVRVDLLPTGVVDVYRINQTLLLQHLHRHRKTFVGCIVHCFGHESSSTVSGYRPFEAQTCLGFGELWVHGHDMGIGRIAVPSQQLNLLPNGFGIAHRAVDDQVSPFRNHGSRQALGQGGCLFV